MRMSRSIVQTLVALPFVGMLGFAGTAFADSIGGLNPDGTADESLCTESSSCQGSTYTLMYSGTPISTGMGTETYRVTYEIDTSTYLGTGTAIDAVAIKISSSVLSSSLFDAPGGIGDWTIVPGGINANGCSGSGGGFTCADFTALGTGAAVGGILSWTFDQTIATGTLFTATQSSIKTRYVNAQGQKVGALLSEKINLMTPPCSPNDPTCGPGGNPVPEPGTMFLMGSGLAGLGFWRWKKGTKNRV